MLHKNEDIGNRIKSNYENRAKNFLTRRIPVIIRVDGKSFSKFCNRFEKPYSYPLNTMLCSVLKYLCENIQGAKFGERHSDEISILVTDFDTLTTDAYFDYSVQKICSITASMATSEFCRQLIINNEKSIKPVLFVEEKWPTFDSRCFNIPEDEISNYFWWRNIDCTRGSINMLAQSKFSHKELQNKNCKEMQEMIFNKFNINWNDLPQFQKTGFICTRKNAEKEIEKGPNKGEKCLRSFWEIESSPKTRNEIDSIISKILNKS